MVVSQKFGGFPGGIKGRPGGRAVVPDSGSDAGFDLFVCLDQQEMGWELLGPRTGNDQWDCQKNQSGHRSRTAA